MSDVYDGKIYFPCTKTCKQAVLKHLENYYSKEEIPQVFDEIEASYLKYLGLFNRDLGGKHNSRNGVGGTYDCIFLFSFYERCKDKMNPLELEEICKSMMSSFQKLSFVNLNKPFFKKLVYLAVKKSEPKGTRFNDYHCVVEPYDKNQPIRYHFTSCPVADFAKQFGFEDILPYLCNVDYFALSSMRAKLVRKNTLGNGPICDYAFCGDQDPYLKEHEEYRDEKGYIRNK